MSTNYVEKQLAAMEEVLREKCRELGLKTTGSGEVLVERLENYKEMTELKQLLKEGQSSGSRKRGHVDEQDQAILDAQLLAMAKTGTPEDVQEALDSGANIDAACRFHAKSALIKACCRADEDDGVALSIVRLLISRGASVHQPSLGNQMPLHWACVSSTAAVVEVLLNARARVYWEDGNNNTPLHLASSRCDEEAIRIVRVLVTHGANVNSCPTGQDATPLCRAAQEGTPEVVEYLLANRAGVNHFLYNNGDSALIRAVQNTVHGSRIIPLLLNHGASKSSTDINGRDAMHVACKYGNGDIVRALSEHSPPGYWKSLLVWSPEYAEGHGDVLGVIDASAAEVKASSFADLASVGSLQAWATLRRAVPDIPAIFAAVARCRYAWTWDWVALELLNARHPVEGTTLFHVAAKANNTVGIEALMKLWANPFILDVNSRTCIDYADDPVVRRNITAYAAQGPRREVVRWYGPCFLYRATAWMLCVERWKRTGRRSIPRDVALMIVHRVMDNEHV